MPKRAKENAQSRCCRIADRRNGCSLDQDAPDLKKPTIAEIFGPGGALEKCMPEGYEHRPSQLEMAELVEAAFKEKRHLIVEAGTGTGKTLAYLIPAIRSGRRVVISTATKSLQEQLFEKDIPFLQKYFAPESESGRDERPRQFPVPRESLPHGRPADAEGSRRSWTGSTKFATGKKSRRRATERSSIFCPTIPTCGSASTRAATRAPAQKCPEFNRCFITAMHQRAAEADLIIVNHHLFFADLALKQDDFGSVLPEYGAVIFDEAHEIEDVASDFFGKQISNYRFEELARDAEIAARVTKAGGTELQKRVARMRERAHSFFEAFPAREGRFPFDKTQRAGFLEQNTEAYDALVNALKSLEAEIASLPAKPEELLNIARRGMELRGELKFLFESSEGNFVYWFERRNKGVFVAATPIDVSALLRERLFEPFETIILTSATLAVGGRFDFLKQRLGVNMAGERVLPSEFDFAEQALFYIPATLPDVRDAAFPERAAQEIVRLLEISEGRAFCLFTSYSQMNDLYERVRTRVRFPLLLQGSAPRSALLEKFRNDGGRGALRHVQLLAGRRRARRATFLRDRGQAAVRRALGSDRRGARQGAAGGRPQRFRGIPGARGCSGAQARLRQADPIAHRPRRSGHSR